MLVFACRFLPAQELSEGWSQFRGPNGAGVVTDSTFPDEFGPEKNVIWKTDLALGYSSPVFHAGSIYLTAEEDKKLITICLDQSSGKERWRKEAPRDRTEKIDFRNQAAAASPAVSDAGVFVFFPDYGMIAYQTDGTEKWRQPLGPFNNLYGMGASPIVVEGRVILVCDQNLDSFVIAFDCATGDIVWKTPREEATSGHCSPIVWRPGPDQPAQILVAGSFHFTSYDVATGKRNWWVGGLSFEMKSTPVVRGDTAYINGFGSPQNQLDQSFQVALFADVVADKDANSDGILSMDEMPDALAKNFFPAVDLDGDGSLDEKEWNYFRDSIASKNSMMAIRLGGAGDMTQQNTRWKYHKNIAQLPSPLLVGDQLLMMNDRGILTSLDPESGAEQFKGRLPGAGGSYYASPVAAGGRIVFATTAGKVAIVQAGDKINVLAVNDLGDGVYATPAIVGDRLYIRTNKTFYCFGK